MKIKRVSIEHKNSDFTGEKTFEGMAIPKKLIIGAVKLSEKTNSTLTTLSFHNCGKLNGWCVHVIVAKHNRCKEVEHNEG